MKLRYIGKNVREIIGIGIFYPGQIVEVDKEIGNVLVRLAIFESLLEKTELMEEYERETGKNAIWRGKITKGFITWKEERLNK